MRKIQNANIENKKVLLRVDFNVSMEKGKMKEGFKIVAIKETLDYLLRKNARVAMLSHLGRPEGKIDPKLSLRQIRDDVEDILERKINFVPDCVGKEAKDAIDNLQSGEVVLLENVRFYVGDEKNDEGFAKKLAENFDFFVNDAFGASHRNQASIAGVAKILPSFAGLRLQKEVAEMEKVKKNFANPAVAIIGGSKIETKLSVINFFEENYDHVLVGGKIANEALEKNMKFSEKIVLPVDLAEGKFDIGPKTIKKFTDIIKSAKTIVWNGPVGKFEEEKFALGTNAVLRAVAKNEKAYSVVGGGETLEVLEKNKVMNKMNFVSTGGGAMLSYLGGNEMPGLEVLGNRPNNQ